MKYETEITTSQHKNNVQNNKNCTNKRYMNSLTFAMAVSSLSTIFSAVESGKKKNKESFRMKKVDKELAIDISYRNEE